MSSAYDLNRLAARWTVHGKIYSIGIFKKSLPILRRVEIKLFSIDFIAGTKQGMIARGLREAWGAILFKT